MNYFRSIPPASWPGRIKRQWPFLGLWLAVAVGLVLVATEYWRKGLVVIAVAVATAGVLRLMMPPKVTGWLVVRSRVTDTVFCFTLAIVLGVLAFSVRG